MNTTKAPHDSCVDFRFVGRLVTAGSNQCTDKTLPYGFDTEYVAHFLQKTVNKNLLRMQTISRSHLNWE